MAGARLRQTFKYPSDGEDSDVSHDEMDEQEQETLITKLRSSETTTNAQYTLIFTALPLVIILPFLRILFLPTTRAKSVTLACLLSITSLLATTYIMYMIPPGAVLFGFKPASEAASLDLSAIVNRRSQRRSGGSRQAGLLGDSSFGGPDSPLTQYLPYLDAFLSVLLVVLAGGFRGRSDLPDGWWAFFLLPGLAFVIVLAVRTTINDVQKGLTELQGMRYGYKGA